MTPEEQQNQRAEWGRVTQFTTTYLALIRVASFLILLGILVPVVMKAYEKSHHLAHWHPAVPHWLAVAPLLLVAVMSLAFRRDRRPASRD